MRSASDRSMSLEGASYPMVLGEGYKYGAALPASRARFTVRASQARRAGAAYRRRSRSPAGATRDTSAIHRDRCTDPRRRSPKNSALRSLHEVRQKTSSHRLQKSLTISKFAVGGQLSAVTFAALLQNAKKSRRKATILDNPNGWTTLLVSATRKLTSSASCCTPNAPANPSSAAKPAG